MNLTDTTLSPIRKGIVGVQFLFVAFGATVLVPLLVGLDPSTALFTAGIGTLIFHLVSKGKVPIFLGSSFAFIAPIIKATELYGLSGTLFGLTGVGLVYFAMSALVKWQGLSVINRIFPPVVIGPVIILIGITLAGTGVQMAEENWVLALISLATAVIVSLKAKGLLKLIPIFCGIGVGYLAALFFYEVDLSGVREAAWFKLPKFVHPTFSWEAFVFMLPVAIAPVIEHIGNIYVVNTVANKDFVKDPGLHRTLLGDGIACMIAGVLGGPPVTTYAEVTGAMSITKVTHPQVIRIAAVTAILSVLPDRENQRPLKIHSQCRTGRHHATDLRHHCHSRCNQHVTAQGRSDEYPEHHHLLPDADHRYRRRHFLLGRIIAIRNRACRHRGSCT